MVELSEHQFQRIEAIVASSVRAQRLRHELIDHCCCAVESYLDRGLTFEESLDQAIQDIWPGGLAALDTDYEHQFQTQIPHTMKTTLYLSGFIAAFCILLGITMRLMHWPGANQVLLTGDLALIVSMIVLFVSVLSYPLAFSRTTVVRTLTGAFGGLLLGAGSAFKIMHWPTASILFVLGMFFITFFFLPLLFWQMYRRTAKSEE